MRVIIIVLFFMIVYLNTSYASDFDERYYFKNYEKYRSVPQNLMLMKHKHVIRQLNDILSTNIYIQVEKIGESIEHRSINMASFGKGKTSVLLWSQMHGDEPTATAALLAIFKYFAENFENAFVQKLYNNITIHAIIMLNPDGAERFNRRNALDIDINRDARLLQTPEGKLLKKMQEKIKPDFGFNLHDMGGRETVGKTDKLLKIALMAPPFKKENDDNSTRIRAKQLAVHIKNTLDKFIQGHISRYKADYMPRAFGDAMQYWGVSTVLIEAGRYTNDETYFLEKMNFICILSAFNAIADGILHKIDHKEYDKIPLEGKRMYDLLIRDALIFNGKKNNPFCGDIAINVDYSLKNGKPDTIGVIIDVGDLSIYKGKKEIKNKNFIITPGFIMPESVVSNMKIKNYVTTVYSNNQILTNNSVLNSKLLSSQIPEFTSIPAKKLELKNKGIIKRDSKADLLIFSQSEKDTLYLNNLKYVIKNGKIIDIN